MASRDTNWQAVLGFVPWPLLGAVPVWLLYPIMVDIRPVNTMAYLLMLGVAMAVLAAAAWLGGRAPLRLAARLRWSRLALDSVAAVACLILIPLLGSEAPGMGRPETIVEGSFFLLPLALAFSASAGALAVTLLSAPYRWAALAATLVMGPAAFLLASRTGDLVLFHIGIDASILIYLPGLLPAAVTVAAIAVPVPMRSAAPVSVLAGAAFLAPIVAWGSLRWLFAPSSLLVPMAVGPLILLALLAAAAGLIDLPGSRRGLLPASGLLMATPIWHILCRFVCDFPT